jgi:plasmid stabilization system protein ParE
MANRPRIYRLSPLAEADLDVIRILHERMDVDRRLEGQV